MSKHEDDYGRLMGYCNVCGTGFYKRIMRRLLRRKEML